ncbi:MAG: spore coat protein CotJB [Firmicutes bacterium]|nr:spore coat protein CotJB [Bacillota bacterium]MBQ3123240.1 spore coat protein CotJB [Bacillota bacterium]MBQ9972312.1 spore coat protein CotJB [Bacillota bacterium]
MNRQEMLRRVQMLCFVVTETGLFLNTHPDDKAALRFYEKYNTLYTQAKMEYEDTYGPLTINGVNTEDGWSWLNGPWPWELEV